MKKIFFTYSDDAEDLGLYKDLKPHFNLYAQRKLLTIIDKEKQFAAGWNQEQAMKELKEADLAIPLISIDYLNDNDCLQQLQAAVSNSKPVVPVILRHCDWIEFDELKKVREKVLPDDGDPVFEHMKKDGGSDRVFKQIALLVKANLWEDEKEKITSLEVRSGSRSFYYLLSGLVLLLGIAGFFLCYKFFQDPVISMIAPLMSLVVAFVIYKKATLPTKFKIK